MAKIVTEGMKASQRKYDHKMHSVEVDHKKALAEANPLDSIEQSMAERGFGSLFITTNKLIKFNDLAKKAFLKMYAVSGRSTFSCTSVGISRVTMNKARRSDPIFDAACEEAEAYYRDLLQEEMHRRGILGFKREVIGGKDRNEVIEITDYSDKAMEMLAKIHVPAMQRKQVEVKNTGAPQTIAVADSPFDLSTMPAEDLQMFKTLLTNQAKRNAAAIAEAEAIEGEVEK